MHTKDIDVPPTLRPPLGVGHSIRRAAELAFLVFSGSIPAEYSLVLPGVGSITRILGALVLVFGIADVVAGRQLRPLPAAFLLLAAFVAWSFMSIVWSVEPELSIYQSITYVQLLIMSWFVWEYVRSERSLDILLQLYVLGALLVAAVTVRNFNAINFARLVITDVRAAAFGANPNELGLAMVTAVPLSLHMLRRWPRGLPALINATYIVIGPVAVLMTASRGAAVALGLAGVGMLVMLRDARVATKLVTALGVAGVVVIGVVSIPHYTWDRLASIGSSLQRMDFNQREANWKAGIEYFTNYPIGGVGAGAFEGASGHLITSPFSSHSTWIGVVVETGLVGAALWFTAVALMLGALLRADAALRRALLAAVVPMMVGMLVTAWDHRKVPWFLFAVALAAAYLPRGNENPAAVSAGVS